MACKDEGHEEGMRVCVRKYRHMGPPMIWYDGHLIPWEVDDYGA